MAVGDVVSSIGITSYQPSSGVEVILLQIWNNQANSVYYLSNGTNNNYNTLGSSAAGIGYMGHSATMKLPITNTNYFTCNGASAISGIQIK